MSGGYEVHLDDLEGLSRVFSREATTISGLTDKCLALPDGGGDPVDSAISDAVQRASAVVSQLAAKVREHGQNLAASKAQYAQAESSNSELVQQTIGLGGGL